MNQPSTDISPGLGGFLAFFLLALALWLLMRSMNTRLRHLSYREEREAAAGAARPAGAGPHPALGQPPEGPAHANGAASGGAAGQEIVGDRIVGDGPEEGGEAPPRPRA